MYFYVKDIDKGFILPPESDHLFSMRVVPNQNCIFCDQNGTVSEVVIENVEKRSREIKYIVKSNKKFENKAKRVLIQAIIDKSYLEKLVELLPFTNYKKMILVDLNYSPKQTVNLERLNNILIRSTEQSQNFFKPQIVVTENFENLLSEYKDNLQILVTQEQIQCYNLKNIILKNPQNILIGPEGGFSKDEILKLKTINTQFETFSDIVYPSWLCGFAYDKQI